MAQKTSKQTNDPGLGIEFEVLLPAYLCLKLLENEEVEDFSLESNAKGFGNVDDLILRIKERNQNELLLFALQLKHADDANAKVHPNNFWYIDKKTGILMIKGDFNLIKYCQTYSKFDDQKKIYHIILFTNRSFDSTKTEEVQNFTMQQDDNCKGRMYFDTSDRKSIYKFSVNDMSKTPQDLSKQDFQEFFEKFSLYTSQCSSRNLENKIEGKLSNNYFGNKSLANDYIAFFRSWHKNEFTNKILTKKIVQVQLIQILLSSCIERRVLITKSNAECRKSEILKKVINSFDIIPIETPDLHNVHKKEHVKDSNIVRFAKDLKIVKKYYDTLTPEEQYDTLLYKGQAPAVILWNKKSKQIISAVLSKILRENSEIPMKMIICGRNIDLNVFSGFCVFNNLSDLHAKDENLFFKVLQNFELSLQGRENILLKQLVDEESCRFITNDDLLKSYNDELTIGMRNEIVTEHYVPRVLAAICLSFEFIIQLTKDLLVINCGDKLEKIKEELEENTKKKVLNMEDFLDTIETASASQQFIEELESAVILSTSDVELEDMKIFSKFQANVHFLKALEEHYFQWIASRGDIQNLKGGNKYGIKEVKEEDVCDIFKKNNVNVICAEPGMGKSVLMEALKKYSPRDHWAVKIDFRECSQMLEAFSNNQDWEEAFCKQVFERNKGSGNRFKDLFLKQQNIYLYFDGLDELQSIHVETAITFIETLASRGFKIWISSRRNFQELLETRFNVFSLNIQEFSEDVQRNYIKNRLSPYYELEIIQEISEKIFDNAKIFNNSKILGIPLQLSMLTEILIQDKEFNEKIFVMTEMFESFFKGKIKHYLSKQTSNTERLQEDYMIMIRSYFEIAGLKSCLDQSFYETLNITESKAYCKFIESDPSKLGIIKSVNEDRVPVFQHNTYGEYFAACYFAENYEAFDLSRLFEPKYDNIRLMFDIKLAQDSSPHLAVIYKDLDRLKTFENVNCKDKGGRTPLHLACCYGEKFRQLQVKNGVIKDNPSVEFDMIREIFPKAGNDLNKLLLTLSKIRNIRVIKDNSNSETDEQNLELYNEIFKHNSSDGINEKNLELNNEVITFLRNTAIDLFAKDKVFEWNSLQYSDATMNLSAIDILIGDEVADWVGLKNNVEKYLDNESLMYYASKFNFKNLFKMLKELIIGEHDIAVSKKSHFREFLNLKTENGENILHVAVKNQSLEMVELLLDEYSRSALDIAFVLNEFDIESKDNEGNTPLLVAARNACLEIFQLLLERGADLNAVNKYIETVLHLSVSKSSNNEILYLALKLQSINVNVKNFEDETALHRAIYFENLEAVELLLTHEEIDIESRDYEENTPLLKAARFSSLEIVQLLLKKGADVDAVTDCGETILDLLLEHCDREKFNLVCKLLSTSKISVNVKNCILHEAIRCEYAEAVKFLLSLEEIDIESRDDEGNTPLHAAEYSNLEIVDLLLEKGADVNAVNDFGETILHLLMRYRDKRRSDIACKLLSTSKINVNVKNFKGETILHKAVRNNYPEVVILLLMHKEIDIESRKNKGNTPLLIAAMSSRIEAFHLLLEKGADVNAINDSGETVLHLLVQCRNKENFDLLCKLLSTSNISVNAKNRKGETIIHKAIRCKNVEVVRYLLTHEEIDIESRDYKGNTPLFVAARFSSLEALYLLLEKGADVNAVNHSSETVLHLLVQYCNMENLDLVRKLLSTSNISVNAKNRKGETILHKAVHSENVEVVKILLTQKEIDIESRKNKGNTPLLIAATTSSSETFRLLLEKGADVNAVNDSGKSISDLLLQYPNMKRLAVQRLL